MFSLVERGSSIPEQQGRKLNCNRAQRVRFWLDLGCLVKTVLLPRRVGADVIKYQTKRVLLQPGSTARARGTQVLSSGEGTKDAKISSTAAQAVELLRNRMSIDISFRVVLPTQSGCCFKKKKKKEGTQHKQKPKLCDRQCLAGRYYVGCIVF